MHTIPDIGYDFKEVEKARSWLERGNETGKNSILLTWWFCKGAPWVTVTRIIVLWARHNRCNVIHHSLRRHPSIFRLTLYTDFTFYNPGRQWPYLVRGHLKTSFRSSRCKSVRFACNGEYASRPYDATVPAVKYGVYLEM